MQHEDAQGELQRRRDVLQHAQRRHGQALRGVGKGDQRHGGHQAGADQQRVQLARDMAKRQLAARAQPHQHGQRGHGDQRRLQRHAFGRRQRGALFDEAVQPEAEGQHQRHPRKARRRPTQPGHASGGQRHADPFGTAESLAQHEHAQPHVDQWQQKVPQAGVQRMPVRDRPDVRHPIDADQQRRQRKAREQRRAQAIPQRGQLAAGAQHGQQQHQRPHHAVGDHLQRAGGRHQAEVQRHQPP